MNSSAEIVKVIKDSFSKVEYPGDTHLVSHHCSECDRVRDTFRNMKWEDLPGNISVILQRNNLGFISFLSPAAFRFYLPGFMIASVENYKETGAIAESLIFHLTRPSAQDWQNSVKSISEDSKGARSGEIKKLKEDLLAGQGPDAAQIASYEETMKLLDAAQLKAVRQFLMFLKQEHPEDDPLGQIDRALSSIERY